MVGTKGLEYPINEDVFAEKYAAAMNAENKEIYTYARLLAEKINAAYFAGLEAGRKEKILIS